MSYVGSYLLQFGMGTLPLLVVLTAVTSKSVLNVAALVLPLAALAMLCVGTSLIVSVLFVYFRDLPYFYELVVFLLWITSPVFYPAAIVPLSVRNVLAFNPIAQVIGSLRQVALSGDLPDLRLAGAALLSGLVVLLVGSGVIRATRYRLMELL
jgi:ABC-type polysaccharide/polyol phosphate export permease